MLDASRGRGREGKEIVSALLSSAIQKWKSKKRRLTRSYIELAGLSVKIPPHINTQPSMSLLSSETEADSSYESEDDGVESRSVDIEPSFPDSILERPFQG